MEEKQENKEIEKSEKDNKVYVGIKPFMNYVTALIKQFQELKQDEVFVIARGKFTSKAIDIVEVARRTFLKDENIKVADIKIGSNDFMKDGQEKKIYVSTIEIRLIREQNKGVKK